MKIFPLGKNVPLAKKFCKNVPLAKKFCKNVPFAKNVSKNAKLFLPHSILLHHCVCLYSFLNRRVNFIPCTYYCTMYIVHILCIFDARPLIFLKNSSENAFVFLALLLCYLYPPLIEIIQFMHIFLHMFIVY